MSDAAIIQQIIEPKPEPKRRAPLGETKRQKFVRLTEARTKRAIAAIRLVASIGGKNRYAYEFSADDVEQIAAALTREIEQMNLRMIAPGRQIDVEFDLK